MSVWNIEFDPLQFSHPSYSTINSEYFKQNYCRIYFHILAVLTVFVHPKAIRIELSRN